MSTQHFPEMLAGCVARWREEGACRSDYKYDILIDGEKAVAISCEEASADSRAAGYMGPDIQTAVAVAVPAEWEHDADISYAMYRRLQGVAWRFPVRGFIRGSVCDLAGLLRASTPGGRPGEMYAVARLVRDAAQEMGDDTSYTPESPLMTALLWLDGLLALRRMGIPGADTRAIAAEWRRLMRTGGVPVFGPAVDALEQMGNSAAGALSHVMRAADIISDAGLDHGTAAGAVLLPKLSGDRQRAAEFYTRPAVAELLAGLVISQDDVSDWGSADIFQEHRLADLACGTGTLLRAGFGRIRNLHEANGGTRSTVATLHRDAVCLGIVGVDVYPAAAHMALSSLAAVIPSVWNGESQIGWMGVGGPAGYTGSIELAAADSIPLAGRVAAGARRHTPVSVYDQSCDWIIMNPPYSRTRIGRAAFDIAGLSPDDRHRCQERWAMLIQHEPARKTAGMAATYLVIAGKKIKDGGRIGFVLPGSAAFVEAWSDTRNYMVHNFTDIVAVAFSGRRKGESLSEDTGIGEMLLVAKKLGKPHREVSPIYCTTIHEYPARAGEAAETARAISSALERIKESGAETHTITAGYGIGEIYALVPDRGGDPWSPLGVTSTGLARTSIHAARGVFCFLDGRRVPFAVRMSSMENVFCIGPTHHLIGYRSGNSPMGAFEIIDGRGPDMFMWTASSSMQKGLVMEPVYTGRAGMGSDADRERMRQQSSTLFYTRRIGWRSQRLLAATTPTPAMGGNAWAALIHQDARVLKAAALWFNSTLGIITHWTRGQRTQLGRSNTEMNALKSIPCPRFADMDGHTLDAATSAFADLSGRTLMPAGRADADPVRQDIDAAVCGMLELPDGALAELDTIRGLFCQEPTVAGR